MQIRQLTLFASAPLNDIMRRSYITTVTPDAMNQLDNATQGGRAITQTAISKIATSFVQPSAEAEGQANIVNGWKTPRFRFLMEVLETSSNGSEMIAYYVGHTDYMEGSYVSLGGGSIDIDGKLMFFVNNVVRLQAQNYLLNNSPATRTISRGSHQIIYGSASMASMMNGAPTEMSMRPYDVFQSQNMLRQMELGGFLDSSDRIFNTTGTALSGAALSSRRNNAPGTYLFDTLNSYKHAYGVAQDYGADSSQIVSEAATLTRDDHAFHDPFFMMMYDKNITDIQLRGQFSWSQLKLVAPYIDSITTIVQTSDMRNLGRELTTWHAGNTCSWHGSDSETIAATLLVNAVPSIMLDNLGASLRFNMTNLTIDGQISHTVDKFTPFTKFADPARLLDNIISRIKVELIPHVSVYGNIPFTLTIDAEAYGDTMVAISLNGQEQRIYVMPTFADNVASPVVTMNSQRAQQVTNDLYQIGVDLMSMTNHSPSVITNPTAAYTPPQTDPNPIIQMPQLY